MVLMGAKNSKEERNILLWRHLDYPWQSKYMLQISMTAWGYGTNRTPAILFPRLKKIIADGGYRGKLAEFVKELGWELSVVLRPDESSKKF